MNISLHPVIINCTFKVLCKIIIRIDNRNFWFLLLPGTVSLAPVRLNHNQRISQQEWYVWKNVVNRILKEGGWNENTWYFTNRMLLDFKSVNSRQFWWLFLWNLKLFQGARSLRKGCFFTNNLLIRKSICDSHSLKSVILSSFFIESCVDRVTGAAYRNLQQNILPLKLVWDLRLPVAT